MTQSLPRISIVIPVYNSEAIIPDLISRIRAVMPDIASSYEVILVNDGSHDRSWDVIAKFPAYQRGGIVQVVGDKVYAGLGEGGNGIRSGFWESSDSLKIGNPISIPDKIGSVSSGVYDEQRNSFFMIDNNGKIWEYNLSSGEWTARSLLGYRMNNYHMFMLNGIIYILGQDLYYANKFIKYNPIWDN